MTREEIESFGFYHIGDAVDIWYKKEGVFDIGSWTARVATMHYGRTDNRLYISVDDSGNEHKLFEGTISTKDEFETLLVQIGLLK